MKETSLFRGFARIARGRRPHRHQFFGRGRMQRHGGVEIGLGGPHFHGDGGELHHLGGTLPDNVTADHPVGPAVDEFSRTTAPNVYAVGDVTNRINLTPVAIREGHAFADTVFGNKSTIVDHANVPTAVFSEPEVGAVGLTEAQARAKLPQTDVYKSMFRPLKATLSGRDTTVLLKLIVDGQTDRVVGCHIVGEGAAEMVQLAAVAVKMRATKADFDATMALHPTIAEELVTMRTRSATYAREAAE